MENQNTQYDLASTYNRNKNPYTVGLTMFASNQERLTSQALYAATSVPGAMLQAKVRPPLDQIVLFPPRFGRLKTEPGLRDCLTVDRFYQGNFNMMSGGPAGYSGSSTPSLGT